MVWNYSAFIAYINSSSWKRSWKVICFPVFANYIPVYLQHFAGHENILFLFDMLHHYSIHKFIRSLFGFIRIILTWWLTPYGRLRLYSKAISFIKHYYIYEMNNQVICNWTNSKLYPIKYYNLESMLGTYIFTSR